MLSSANAARKGHLCASKALQSFFFKCPAAVYICAGRRRKVNRKGTSAEWISNKIMFAQPPDTNNSLGKKLGLHSPPFMVSYRQSTDKQTD